MLNAEINTWKQLVPVLHALPRREKVKVMKFLLDELAEEESELLTAHQAYPIWTPLQADRAAETLLALLAEKNGVKNG
ncbi:MAG TPA: hypothetical protein PK999_13335 [Nitrospira sp.]|nr:hypothetical protein [Nitrospira sp.]